MNYDDRDDDEENLIYEESPPDFPYGMSIYEPENTDEDPESTDDGTEIPNPSKKLLKRDMLAIALTLIPVCFYNYTQIADFMRFDKCAP